MTMVVMPWIANVNGEGRMTECTPLLWSFSDVASDFRPAQTTYRGEAGVGNVVG